MAVPVLKLVLFLLSLLVNSFLVVQGTSWCVVRSDASNQALQTALDYACGTGADCSPLQSSGLCFLPNTIQAHAAYAFNSYYQRRAMAPGSCDFAGTATVAKTDPSYGSCVYPSSQSTAGGIATPTTPTTVINNPNVPTTTPINGGGSAGVNNPGLTPPIPTTNDSKASLDCMVATSSMSVMILLVLSFILHPIWIF
ncbi:PLASMODESMATA CALLOSE-BINDING PROTEIN 3-like [Durio zibethinus]|uniref:PLASMODESMATA CALLOSE-BINDING PROTEIN 3-like n=1 Tax=Durio zibethinus TaxID=66656 RepID=A0A6P5Y192_DURZI|nr:PLASMODESMATA CALLOSE-BINDING PROTEIN 3-like [Durio zibethinus]